MFFPPNESPDHKSPISLFMDRFEYFFFFDLEIWWGFKKTTLYFPQMCLLTTKVQFPCLWTDLNNSFSLTWKFDGNTRSDIVLYLKWLTGPQKFVIMIRFKFNFDMIWYSLIFAANLYLNLVFMNVVILVYIILDKDPRLLFQVLFC